MNSHFLKSIVTVLFFSFCLTTNSFAAESNVVDGLTINVRVYLEGALINNNGATSDDGRQLMRDNLRRNPITEANYLPSSDPFSHRFGYVDVAARFNKVGPGANPLYQTIPNPEAVFSVSGSNAIVDWIFVELRDKNDKTKVLATRSGLLQRDGDIVDLDGKSGLTFEGVAADNYYVTIKHYKHFGVMSKYALSFEQLTTLVDFTSPNFPTFDYGTSHPSGVNYTGLAQNTIINGIKVMWAGDFDGNGLIKLTSPDDDLSYLQMMVLTFPDNTEMMSNYAGAYGYSTADYDMNGLVKLDNPDDDMSFLTATVLLYDLNTTLASNFALFIEQLP